MYIWSLQPPILQKCPLIVGSLCSKHYAEDCVTSMLGVKQWTAEQRRDGNTGKERCKVVSIGLELVLMCTCVQG